jgi:hypothetical protein
MGRAGDDQRVIARARRFEPDALALCAFAFNARLVNSLLDAEFGISLPWVPMPMWLPARAGWLQCSDALGAGVPIARLADHVALADRSLTCEVLGASSLMVGPRPVPVATSPDSESR